MIDRYEGSFFGRRKGKPLSPRREALMKNELPRLALDLSAAPPEDLRDLFGGNVDTVCLEVGFGGGEHLLHRARTEPHTGFIGVEPFVGSMAKVVTSLLEEQLANVRLYDDDAVNVLDWLPEASIDLAYQLYPDPWPKKRHWKRRFINSQNLDRYARVIKPGSEFRFASDIDTYIDWTLRHCRDHPAFDWTARTASDWKTPWVGWPGTRYEAKAVREGRVGRYLTFRRV
ncbi:tRNA (guanosine(46)-N7)-methyltransferase TrmB [Roseibium denhamense]|uniref:tRNA (guanine-N(7)-)-methyltransferase n=1 Tax=Roseibium denhamense TaxID=76305 RepID=A0ABY1PLE4_9HYPH|nr:tRNA (guanine(46)-N(7))-methyltransferase TrmB [Roseibium denhamense]MTI06931.1 tRNA (guanosine(46)-N7)-methyltransferase TrmB [Roseibium denhamense]SMP36736.1 tRNA (guanine-N7-)-methyltransferase [Roseibium denhamense]